MKAVLSSLQISEEMGFDPASQTISQLSSQQLKDLAARITESVTYEQTSIHTFFVLLLNQSAQMTLSQPSGAGGVAGGSTLSIDSWGEGVAKAILETYNDFVQNGISQPGANALSSTTATSRRTVRQSSPTAEILEKAFSFILKVDRLAADGTLKNDVPFCFKFDSNASSVGVLVKHDSDPGWHNINSQCTGEGVNRWCGNCTHHRGHYTCCVAHTSTFTAFAVPETATAAAPSSGINLVMFNTIL